MHFTRLHWFTIKKQKKKISIQTFEKGEREGEKREREGMGVAILIQK